MKTFAFVAALLFVGFICGFFVAIEMHHIDRPCLLNTPPCVEVIDP